MDDNAKLYYTGVEKIAKERDRQLNKGRTAVADVINNKSGQIRALIEYLVKNPDNVTGMTDMDVKSAEFWCKGWSREAIRKYLYLPYAERLVLAGAFIAAELDRADLAEALEIDEVK